MTSTRRTSRFSAAPSAGHVSIRRDVRQAGIGDGVLQAVSRLHCRGDHAHPRRRRQLGQALQRLEMRLRQERDAPGSPGPPGAARPPEDGRSWSPPPPIARSLLTPHGGRQLLEEHLVHADRQLGLELAAKKSSSGGLHSTRRTSAAPRTAAGPTPATLRTPTATSSGVIPRAAARITMSCRKALATVRGRAGRRAGATNTPFPAAPPRTRPASDPRSRAPPCSD